MTTRPCGHERGLQPNISWSAQYVDENLSGRGLWTPEQLCSSASLVAQLVYGTVLVGYSGRIGASGGDAPSLYHACMCPSMHAPVSHVPFHMGRILHAGGMFCNCNGMHLPFASKACGRCATSTVVGSRGGSFVCFVAGFPRDPIGIHSGDTLWGLRCTKHACRAASQQVRWPG